ncbi:hypothetical protein HQ584_02330 [Patescibacteria group bacterium]|nr:hypothetical protein [Patescibacteria group bacterium]
MIRKRTTLILGAGSSQHLFFPLGQELIRNVCDLIYVKSVGVKKQFHGTHTEYIEQEEKNSVLLSRFLEKTEHKKQDGSYYSPEDIEKFAQDLYQAQTPSIDTFLTRRSEYSLLGKLCVIFCLSRYENEGDHVIYKPWKSMNPQWSFDFGWYQYLWHRMVDGCEKLDHLKQNKLKIITFNYDRSLEHFLITAIKSCFGVNEADAAEVFKHIKIKHVFGKLGKFYWEVNYLEDNSGKTADDYMLETAPYTPWELRCFFRLMGDVGEYGMDRRDFEGERTVLSQDARKGIVKKFNHVVKNIKTYHEIVEEKKTKEYYEDLQNSEKVCFFGFGYHSQNLKALGFHDRKIGDFELSGSMYGFSDLEKETEESGLRVMTSKQSPKFSNKLHGRDFFEHFAPLE